MTSEPRRWRVRKIGGKWCAYFLARLGDGTRAYVLTRIAATWDAAIRYVTRAETNNYGPGVPLEQITRGTS